jgi:hypothetical protein
VCGTVGQLEGGNAAGEGWEGWLRRKREGPLFIRRNQ